MKIAYISFDFPPETSNHETYSYAYTISVLMSERGHEVEVFTASSSGLSLMEQQNDNLLVHRIYSTDRDDFHKDILPIFSERHKITVFDLVESGGYRSEGLSIKQAFPGLPMIIRFSSLSFRIKMLNEKYNAFPFTQRLKKITGLSEYKKEKDKEYMFALSANALSLPSVLIRDALVKYWNLDPSRITVIPNPYLAPEELLDLPVETSANRITFICRPEMRKAISPFGAAIPLVLEKYPAIQFRLVAKTNNKDNKIGDLGDYIKDQPEELLNNIEFKGYTGTDPITPFLAETDICVLPGSWDSFEYDCLDAMSAAKGIVANRESSMKDMLENIKGGKLVDPESPREIADAILFLLDNPEQRFVMGIRCRAKAILYYRKEVIKETEPYYEYIGGATKK